MSSEYHVASSRFDLKTPKTPPSPTQTVEELVEECTSLQTQIESLENRLAKKKAYLVSNRHTIDALVKPAYT